MITRISDNNTATVKTPHGVKEYNYNTQMFKLFHPKTETPKEKEMDRHTGTIKESETKTKRQKKVYPKREDGGPTTRSKTAQERVLSYSEVLKAPARKVIKKTQVTINAHEIKEFVKTQKQATQINQIATRKAAAIRSKADIQKLNTEQWTSLKESVKSETIKWKNSLVRNEWCNIGTYWKLDKFGLPSIFLEQEFLCP